MSRRKCDVYRSLPLILSGTGVEFTQTYAFAKNVSITLSLMILRFLKEWAIIWNYYVNVWFVGVYKKNKSATAIRVRTVLKGGWYLNFTTSWGMVSDKVIVVSADGILRVLNVSSHFVGCYNKRRWLRSRMTSLQVMYYFGYAETFTIPSDRFAFLFRKAHQPPSGPEVKWDA